MPPVKPLANATKPATPAKPATKPAPAKPAAPTKPANPPAKPTPVKSEVIRPGRERQTITKDDIGTVDAATLAPVDSNKLAKAASAVPLPSWLQKSTLPETNDRQVGDYVGFGSEQSNKWDEMSAAGVQDGQPYLKYEGRYIPLESLNFFLLSGESFKTLMVGREGKFKWASRDLNEEGPTQGSNRPEEHYVMMMLVEAEGTLIPIKGDFRGTKSGGMMQAIRAVEAAATPEWLDRGDAYKVTGAYPHPFGRVYHKITTSYHVSKSTGNPYYRANCVSLPATITQMQTLIDCFSDPDFVSKLDAAKANFDDRVRFLDTVASGEVEGQNG